MQEQGAFVFPSIYQPFLPKLFWECYSALVCEPDCYFLLAREGLVESQARGSLARASIRAQGRLGTKHMRVTTVCSVTGESPLETRSLRLIGQVLVSVSWYRDLFPHLFISSGKVCIYFLIVLENLLMSSEMKPFNMHV